MNCGCNKRNKAGLLLALLTGLIVLCVAVSTVTSQFMISGDNWSQHDAMHGHQWLHKELDLTDEEAASIDAFEPEYRQQKAILQAEFQAKIEALRELLVDSDHFSPEVQQAIHELHMVHGQLQELSIRHYFQMMSVLSPQKQARLKQLAGQVLSIPQ
ncbi:periplasmic heavy metal sensor [Ruficoccus sp. ZRK36]|uniref:Spy/CpxP family protein refolding chaperone n=1 Tax=Ruficoccus sp. ZRK36 TaxID=2866311 RepID=UPI001C73D950|nr:periplasmic heavy metal sensor [Ruficoccus sp. ZRK36]QYY36733.1 periplasmic heavy metal sensor [Ruficoccus sp. ZRK36]